MAYTGIDDPTSFFNTVLYTGNATTPTNITGVGFQPDWVWIKNRDNSEMHILADVVRGVNKLLESNTSDAELSDSNYIKSFASDGFQIGSEGAVNGNTQGQVAWNWKAGTSFSNDASSTGVGTIDSTGSVSTDAGISIISFTGTGSAATIAHGLGKEVDCIIIKNRNDSAQWSFYHRSVGATKYMAINSTSAAASASTQWNNTDPTSSVFSVGTSNNTNDSSDGMIAYCFSSIKGYSKFGGYTGNGNSDGPFIHLGFRPAFFLIKRTDAAYQWYIHDNKRNTSNVMDKELYPSVPDAEATVSTKDFLSNGVKIRGSQVSQNASGGTYIYMAFSESPFVNSKGVPNNAR